MSKEESNIDHGMRVTMMYKNYPDMLNEHVKARNEMAEKLNEKVIRIMKVSPLFGILGEDGRVDFDVTTKEILIQIKNENEKILRKAFPDLYLLADYEKEN